MIQSVKKITVVVGSLAVFLLLMVAVFALVKKTPSAQQVASEADKLKIANARAMADLNASQSKTVRPVGKDDYFFNKVSGPTELIVYCDFDCPFCRQYFSVLEQVKKTFSKELNIVWRHFPLPSHAGSLVAAQAFECAREQNKAGELFEALFDNQNKNDNNIEGILADAQALNLKLEDFRYCLNGEKYKTKILAHKEEAELFGVNGTPTSFLNNRLLPGAYQFNDFTDADGRRYDGLKTLIERALSGQDQNYN